MQIQHHISLQPFNTFGIDAYAKYWLNIETVEQLQAFILQEKSKHEPIFILGGGSNILLKNNFEGCVLKMNMLQKKVVKESHDSVWIQAGAGENWHDFVLWALEHNYYGIENLSFIPGTVGASPIQNIGAYGVELKDVFYELEAVHLETGAIRTFSHSDCEFGYRNSVFKNELKGQFCITSVTFQLSKQANLNLNYGAIRNQLAILGILEENCTPKNVSDAVIAIRSSKLPDPKVIGNSGSFFKNPEVSQAFFEALQNRFPAIVFYNLPNEMVKIPAGWLIEQCGWKGKIVGNTGTYQHQALVLVNHGNATGEEVYQLSEAILQSVCDKFGIELSREVNVIE